MKTRNARRSLLLFSALALSLAATGWLAAQEKEVAKTAEAVPLRPAPREVASPEAGRSEAEAVGLRLEELRRPASGTAVKELFAARTWQAAPAPSITPATPPPVAAPDLPFTYLGKMLHGGATTVFLSWQDRRYTVKAGDMIDGSYRVDSISGPLMTLTYLPLDTQQTMHLGDTH